MSVTRVLGVDACRKGWVGLDGDLRAYFGADIADLVGAARRDGELAVVAIDVPIGLPAREPREADKVARTVVGPRFRSVFPAPIRASLMANSHQQASAVSRKCTGKGMSQQAYGLRHKILDVDGWVEGAGTDVIEIHPEVSFAVMAKHPLRHAKSTWSGLRERLDLLAVQGIHLLDQLGADVNEAKADDVVDAAAAMWTAKRWVAGASESFPSQPEPMTNGQVAAIYA